MIYTFSSFLLPVLVNTSNQNLNLDEGSGEILAQITVGTYVLSDLPAVLTTALNAAGNDTYSVTADRAARTLTITSDGTFSLLVATGSQAGTSIFSDIGFTGADRATGASHESNNAISFLYKPQFMLQKYVAPEHFKEKIDASVNESSSGVVETVSYGTRRKAELEIKFITSRLDVTDGIHILYNPTGLEDALTFMDGIITKNTFEFMPDKDNPDTFFKVKLAKTPADSKGVGFKLNELSSEGLPDVYESGKIELRVIE